MPWMRTLLFGAGLGTLVSPVRGRWLKGSRPRRPPPTFRITSNLVFLDVTVLDKKGHPVVTGLTSRDDFTIIETAESRNGSFRLTRLRTGAKTEAHAPATILVTRPSEYALQKISRSPATRYAISSRCSRSDSICPPN